MQLFFNILVFSSLALKRWNFQDNLDFKCKTVAQYELHIQNQVVYYFGKSIYRESRAILD